MALKVDRIQVQPFPPFQQDQHDAPAQQDIRSPTLLHRAASFESTNDEDVQDTPVSPGVKRNFSDTSLSSKNESSIVKENFAAGKDILRRVTR